MLPQTRTCSSIDAAGVKPLHSSRPLSSSCHCHSNHTHASGPGSSSSKTSREEGSFSSAERRELKMHSRRSSGKHALPIQTLFEEAPRIRVRNLSDRQMEQLGELVVANERLAGRPVPKARQRVEFLKRRREVWEQIYDVVTKEDAAATLAALEEAHKQVAAAMSKQSREQQSVTALKRQLVEVQAQVAVAHAQLHHTQDLVQLNQERIQQLTAEARAAQDAAELHGMSNSAQHSVQAKPARQHRLTTSGVVPVQPPVAKNSWVPVAFSEMVGDGMTKFQYDSQPWVLFRDAQGAAACIEDCCAHRACPLSLGKVVNGHVMCAYHGWQYNAHGDCTEMPSTMMCPGIRVNSLACKERDSIVWVLKPEACSQDPVPTSPVQMPDGFIAVGRAQTDIAADASVLEDHVLSHSSILAISDRGGALSWADAAASWVLGAQEGNLAEVKHPGWVTCRPGRNVMEIHTLIPSRPGQCRWMYQLAVRKAHWGSRAVPKHFWQKLCAQAINAHKAKLERLEWPSTGVPSL